jgi:hypothetical protein
VRRTKDEVLKGLLGEKKQVVQPVNQHPGEISIQEYYEQAIMRTLQEFSKVADAVTLPAMERKKCIFTVLMSQISCAVSSLDLFKVFVDLRDFGGNFLQPHPFHFKCSGLPQFTLSSLAEVESFVFTSARREGN